MRPTSRFRSLKIKTQASIAVASVLLVVGISACGSGNPTAGGEVTSAPRTKNAALVAPTCAEGGVCKVGDIGPGGGKVIGVGAYTHGTCGTSCSYLEIAPSGWANNLNYVPTDPKICKVETPPNDPLCRFALGSSIPGKYRGGGFTNWITPNLTMMPVITNVNDPTLVNSTYWTTDWQTKDYYVWAFWPWGSAKQSRGSTNQAYVRAVRPFGANQTISGMAEAPLSVQLSVQPAQFDSPSVTYSVKTGTLPDGLSLNAATGLISGTPKVEAAGVVEITVKGSVRGFASTSVTFDIKSAKQVLTPPSQDISVAAGGSVTTGTFTATNFTGSVTYAVTAGVLPTGLSLNAANGVISGTPTTPGVASLTLTATGATKGTATATIKISVLAAAVTPSSQQLAGEVDLAFTSAAMTATNFVGAVTYSITAGVLPTGLSLNAANGVISGTPTMEATAGITVVAKGATAGSSSATINIKVGPKTCARGGVCRLGDVTPLGGVIFYAPDTPFTVIDSPCGTNCRFLEAAAPNWFSGGPGGLDPTLTWSDGTGVTPFPRTNGGTSAAFGSGFKNTAAMRAAGATLVKNMDKSLPTGNWFIPSLEELKVLLKAPQPGLKLLTQLIKDREVRYWSSSEFDDTRCDTSKTGRCASMVYRDKNDGSINEFFALKGDANNARPIRAF